MAKGSALDLVAKNDKLSNSISKQPMSPHGRQVKQLLFQQNVNNNNNNQQLQWRQQVQQQGPAPSSPQLYGHAYTSPQNTNYPQSTMN
eukprot:229795_1